MLMCLFFSASFPVSFYCHCLSLSCTAPCARFHAACAHWCSVATSSCKQCVSKLMRIGLCVLMSLTTHSAACIQCPT